MKRLSRGPYPKERCECGRMVSIGGMQRAAHLRGSGHRIGMNAKLRNLFKRLGKLETSREVVFTGLPTASTATRFDSLGALLTGEGYAVMHTDWPRGHNWHPKDRMRPSEFRAMLAGIGAYAEAAE